MIATITKLYDNEKTNKDGQKVVNALFYWDGENRCVPVKASVHEVGDKIEVHLREVYSREKQKGYKWWECVED